MDSRQPHPFARNTASPYGRNAFPSTSQSALPPSSQPTNAVPAYAEHQRRPSEPSFYTPRNYGRDEPPMAGPGHSRHQSASSIGQSTPGHRTMLPPTSPQQQHSQQASLHHKYGPPPPRAPPVSVGPPTSFPSGRELPSLANLGRPASTGTSSMSISSMLGGFPPAARDSTPSQYAAATSGPPNQQYPGPAHTSPRSTATDYTAYRRPQTPDHQRAYEPRDPRNNSAGSPQAAPHYSTPDSRRFGTPQSYGQRAAPPEDRREPARVPNPNAAIPPRPSSQPISYNAPISRPPDNPHVLAQNESLFGRRIDNVSRAEPPRRGDLPYQRHPALEERRPPAFGYAERERQEREAVAQREREQREREQLEGPAGDRSSAQEYPHQVSQRNAVAYNNRAPERDPREQQAWMRPGYEARPPYEQPGGERNTSQPAQGPTSHGYEYPPASAPPYGGPLPYGIKEDIRDPRYGRGPAMQQHRLTDYEVALAREQDRQRLAQQQEQQRQQALYIVGQQNGPYQPNGSPGHRIHEESQQMQQQRSFLGVQEINRKGRASPLPQAVQGAQGQLGGPGGEPGIKSEFGRMFSGIGSGVGGAMGASSPVGAGPQGTPFSNQGQLRREDLEAVAAQDTPLENGGTKIARSSSGGGSRRRKLKEEDSRGDDESSNGRLTPSGRGKRPKTHIHTHGQAHHHHHHHHRHDTLDLTSSPLPPNLTPFKNAKGNLSPSDVGIIPNLHHHHVARHHHHPTPPAPKPQVNPVIPLSRKIVHSQAVLDSVAHKPRKHLGHVYYESTLKPGGPMSPGRTNHSRRGFASTPRPLPLFEGNENCTFTIKVPRIHLSHSSREEITRRKAVWGTDIYTDDSDIIAACIHQGWFRGAWADDVDVSLLGLEIDVPDTRRPQKDEILYEPPPHGPWEVPHNRDLHVTILILPRLELYSSMVRFGIKSREWGGKHDGYKGVHDGVSFTIHSVQWVEGVEDGEGTTAGQRRTTRRRGDEDWQVEDADASAVNGNGFGKESFERGGPDGLLPLNMASLALSSWLKKPKKGKKVGIMNSDKEKQKEQEKEKEKDQETEEIDGGSTGEQERQSRIDLVTERMLQNANASARNNALAVGGDLEVAAPAVSLQDAQNGGVAVVA